ncbi:MAG: hypothetical protein ABI330_16240 [Caldimonas sp.]
MDSPTLKDKLMALKPGTKSVYIRRLARVLPEIEDALDKGVSREAVVKTLQEDGIDITFNGFAKALYRLRKRAKTANESLDRPPLKDTVLPEPHLPPESLAHTPPDKRPFEPNDIRNIARSRPDLNELTRLGREAAKAAKGKDGRQ